MGEHINSLFLLIFQTWMTNIADWHIFSAVFPSPITFQQQSQVWWIHTLLCTAGSASHLPSEGLWCQPQSASISSDVPGHCLSSCCNATVFENTYSRHLSHSIRCKQEKPTTANKKPQRENDKYPPVFNKARQKKDEATLILLHCFSNASRCICIIRSGVMFSWTQTVHIFT